MINTGTNSLMEAKGKASQLKCSINNKHKELKIDIENMFVKLLLLQKKKYAGLAVSSISFGDPPKRIVKGLDMIRHDLCPLAATLSSFVLDKIFEKGTTEDLLNDVNAHLKEKTKEIYAGKISLKEYIISKGITKQPEQYSDAQKCAHKTVAYLVT